MTEYRVQLLPEEHVVALTRLTEARATELEAAAAAARAETARRVLVLCLGELAKRHGLTGEIDLDTDGGVLKVRSS